MTTEFCLEALQEARRRYWRARDLQYRLGRQFTAEDFTALLLAHGVRVSMDGEGGWVDNVFVKWLWRSVKYEHIYLHAHETVREVKTALKGYFDFYNASRPHQSLHHLTPDEMYSWHDKPKQAA